MDKLVSIITLTYNSKFLKNTIDSVLSQNYSKIEYIIADDCSKELDLDYWESYIGSKKRDNIILKIIRNEKNLGIIRNLNKAVGLSEGEIIFLCSHDDLLYDSNVISDWVNEFSRTSADIITAKREVYDCDMKKVIGIEPIPRKINYMVNKSSDEIFHNLSLYKNFIFGASTAFSKACFEKYGFFNEKYKHIEDYPMVLKVSREGGKIVFFDRLVLKYRSGGISDCRSVNKEYFDEETQIVKNEIIPYTNTPKLVMRHHKQWIRRTLERKRVYDLKQKYGEKSFSLFLYCMKIKCNFYLDKLICFFIKNK